MGKRYANEDEISGAPRLPLMLEASAHRSDTISSGSRPEVYGIADLLKEDSSGSTRTTEFEKRLVAIYWLIARPVPFIFRTADGQLRSLDAGCLGYLANRIEPDVELIEARGVVVAAVPGAKLLARMEQLRSRIESMVLAAE